MNSPETEWKGGWTDRALFWTATRPPVALMYQNGGAGEGGGQVLVGYMCTGRAQGKEEASWQEQQVAGPYSSLGWHGLDPAAEATGRNQPLM
jgi:hypothetical protein